MKTHYISLLVIAGVMHANVSISQSYKAPQDTPKVRRSPKEILDVNVIDRQPVSTDSRLVGCAVKAAIRLKDTSSYDYKKGLTLTQLFDADDLRYIANQGTGGAAALFDLINQNLAPRKKMIFFRTADMELITNIKNPLVLENLRATIAINPGKMGEQQWKENIYLGYMARDYGTKLFNTITIDAATTEIQQSGILKLIDFNGRSISLNEIRNREKTETDAVLNFREHTFPNAKMNEQDAHENYKRALFELINLQESDINRHTESKKLLFVLGEDLQQGNASKTLIALKNSSFFDDNIAKSNGPVLLTESDVLNPVLIANNARQKAMEILMLTALHYGERDAVTLLKQLITGQGSNPASGAGFSTKRVNELTEHGAEKFKSLGFGKDKTAGMSSADLVLVAVASPAVTPQVSPDVYIGMINQVSQIIVNQYSTSIEETTTVRNSIIFNPRIGLSSRHTEYRASFDPIDFVPELLNGQPINQRGSRITQDGVELRLESDLYFSNTQKLIDKGIKPVIYPEFGILAGFGNRKVGYDESTIAGPFGAVPKFQSRYSNWGLHIGVNIGPIVIATDATILTTPVGDSPQTRFFDLSQSMTYFRYQLLTHVLNYKLKTDTRLTLDLNLAIESNNEGFDNITFTQGTDAQIQSPKWQQDYGLVHSGGVYNQTLATSLLNDGYVKASYSAGNYASVNLGVQKSAFKLTITGGLYNLYTRTGYQLYHDILENTLKGNLWGSVGLTYQFGSKNSVNTSYKNTSSSTSNPAGRTEQSSSAIASKTQGPRDHAIFSNKK